MQQYYQEITLVRHGRSSYPLPTHCITAAEFRKWIADYNQAGIAADSLPPPELIAATRSMPYVVCSDLPRAMASASLLSPGQAPFALPLLREAGRPVNSHWPVKLPLAMWDRLSVFLWTMGLIASDESVGAARLRAQEAAGTLMRLAEGFDRVLCVGHGMFNALVGQVLLDLGWEGPPRVASRHWAATTYQKRAHDTAGKRQPLGRSTIYIGENMEQTEFDEKFSQILTMFRATPDSYQFRGDDVWMNVGSNPLDNIFTELSSLYIAANDTQRSALYEYCGRQPAIIQNLWYYIRRIGKLIETKDDTRWLGLGIAGSLLDGGRFDFRDTITSLALLRFAAERVGIETRPIFDNFIQSTHGNVKIMLENVRDHPESSIRSSVEYFGPPEWK